MIDVVWQTGNSIREQDGRKKLGRVGTALREWAGRLRRLAKERRERWSPIAVAAWRESGLSDRTEEDKR
jgi:hypothetical protein